MPSKMSELAKFYIDNNLHLTDVELARTTGCSVRQVKNRRAKGGKNREGNPKGEPENTLLQKQESKPPSGIRIDSLLAKKSGTVSLTGAASEALDAFDGIGPGA